MDGITVNWAPEMEMFEAGVRAGLALVFYLLTTVAMTAAICTYGKLAAGIEGSQD